MAPYTPQQPLPAAHMGTPWWWVWKVQSLTQLITHHAVAVDPSGVHAKKPTLGPNLCTPAGGVAGATISPLACMCPRPTTLHAACMLQPAGMHARSEEACEAHHMYQQPLVV
jgi:hypothetical protein